MYMSYIDKYILHYLSLGHRVCASACCGALGGGSLLLVCVRVVHVPTYLGGVFREKIFFTMMNSSSLSKTPTKSILDFGRRSPPPWFV